ncbi:group III truncated hemoglobin [Flagellimonas nanhaiensis]|uniref:Group III truncated hemoglobin n=1 Tax=Flagellimonas nanhaiensis TaxID=2292706 RepID=A0A371JNN9_9FLAO|nr:group III truncated hemoglobin [Allomuricauda nanhaiensis]RDY58851.1 group III truncated hemoglobin [Allomuricauda nanhaiensis]
MSKGDIYTREDVKILVTKFYEKVRQDDEIGHFFNDNIQDWPEHIEKLTDFWETNLFFVQKYKDNPLLVHAQLDEKVNRTIENYHFGIWLRHWFDTIDRNFVGANAEKAKQRARNISVRMFMAIFDYRKLKSS